MSWRRWEQCEHSRKALPCFTEKPCACNNSLKARRGTWSGWSKNVAGSIAWSSRASAAAAFTCDGAQARPRSAPAPAARQHGPVSATGLHIYAVHTCGGIQNVSAEMISDHDSQSIEMDVGCRVPSASTRKVDGALFGRQHFASVARCCSRSQL